MTDSTATDVSKISPHGPRPARRARGFTFVELVIVVVILGVLAAVALPRILNLARDARVASVEGLAGAIASAADLAHMRWALTNPDMGGVTVDLGGGQFAFMWRGYPDAGNCCAADGIEAMIDISGFTLTQLDNERSRYSHDSAPTPAACSATYREAINPGDRYTVTIVTTGC